MLFRARPIHVTLTTCSIAIWTVVNDTGDIDRTVLRIIAVTGAASRATCAAVGNAPRDNRRPQDFDIAVGAAHNLPGSLLRISGIRLFLLRMFRVHILVTCCIRVVPVSFPIFSISQVVLEQRRRSVREVLESIIFHLEAPEEKPAH